MISKFILKHLLYVLKEYNHVPRSLNGKETNPKELVQMKKNLFRSFHDNNNRFQVLYLFKRISHGKIFKVLYLGKLLLLHLKMDTQYTLS